MRVSNLLPAVALLPTTFGQLHKLASAKGKYFGSATDNYELGDAPYKAILLDGDEFGQVTPGNLQKWLYSEPSPGVFNFAGGDEIADLAEKEGLILRCHPLIWHSQAPDWVTKGSWTNETLIAAVKGHIKGMVEHFKGRCAHWDVVNEAFEEDGTYRKTVFYDIIGPEYIPIAFETAALYDQNVKLYLNDYNLEYNGAKTEATRQLVKSLLARGIKIDGVGYQGHLIVGKTPSQSQLTANLQSFIDLGVEVAYTEIDIRHETLPPTAEALAQQDKDYVNTVLSCINLPKCVGLTIWDFTDKYSWIPGVFKGQGDALLWDTQFKKKQVYWAVVKALGGSMPTPSATPATTPAATTPALTTPPATKTPTSTLMKCNRDNCLRNLVDVRYSDDVSAFCSTYTTAVVTEAAAIPTYLAGCSGLPGRVSSACSCAVTANTTTEEDPACT